MPSPHHLEPLDNILEAIGWTPLVRLHRVTQGIRTPVLIKCEQLNPGASVKDRIGVAIIEAAERNGTLKPGGLGTVGTLTVNGNFSQTSAGVTDFELASSSSYDKLVVTGSAALNGTANATGIGGYLPTGGESFVLVSATPAISGNFATVNHPPAPPPYTATVSGNQFILSTAAPPSPPPPPASPPPPAPSPTPAPPAPSPSPTPCLLYTSDAADE